MLSCKSNHSWGISYNKRAVDSNETLRLQPPLLTSLQRSPIQNSGGKMVAGRYVTMPYDFSPSAYSIPQDLFRRALYSTSHRISCIGMSVTSHPLQTSSSQIVGSTTLVNSSSIRPHISRSRSDLRIASGRILRCWRCAWSSQLYCRSLICGLLTDIIHNSGRRIFRITSLQRSNNYPSSSWRGCRKGARDPVPYTYMHIVLHSTWYLYSIGILPRILWMLLIPCWSSHGLSCPRTYR